MGWTRNEAEYVCIAQSSAIRHPHQFRQHADVHAICHSISHENGRRNIPAQQELLPVLQEHRLRMLQMLDENVQPQYKVSNMTTMTG
jgi:hypothetical protein